MIKFSVEDEVRRAIANGHSEANEFVGAINSNVNAGLMADEELTFPEEYKIMNQELNGRTIQYVFVESNMNGTKPFYPSTFVKNRRVVNEDTTSTGEVVRANGTAVEFYFNAGPTVAEGMNALKGKRIKVSALTPVRCLRYGTMEVRTEYVPTLDLID